MEVYIFLVAVLSGAIGLNVLTRQMINAVGE